jgi:hypothetical protein
MAAEFDFLTLRLRAPADGAAGGGGMAGEGHKPPRPRESQLAVSRDRVALVCYGACPGDLDALRHTQAAPPGGRLSRFDAEDSFV